MKNAYWRHLFLPIFLVVLFLTGCTNTEESTMSEKKSPLEQQVLLVQEAVDAFVLETDELPAMTKSKDTCTYERHIIEFAQLIPKYMPYVPEASFEQGGSYAFVLTDVETKPTVHLLDLKIADQILDIQSRVFSYVEKYKELPVTEEYESGYLEIDRKEIDLSESKLTVRSPITGEKLPVILSPKGVVGIDYKTDLVHLQKEGTSANSFQSMEDVRDLLTKNTLYVPVKSFPYKENNGYISLKMCDK